MKRKLSICLLLLILYNPIYAQDYFTDLNSGTTPLLFNGTDNALFSATINAGDNSVKATFFRQYWTNSKTYKPLNVPRHKYFWGWDLAQR